MLARDHYATLGVPPDASPEEIESAFEHLSRRYHPDINPGDPRAATVYERIEEAYRVLSDPERRARYDREASPLEDGEELVAELELEVRDADEADDEEEFDDLFRQLLSHARRDRPRRGGDVDATVRLPLSQVERGRRTTVRVRRLVPCETCDGEGRLPRGHHRPCERCAGDGKEVFTKGVLAVSCTCTECGGEGVRVGSDCEDCRGTGLESRTEDIVARIPPGITDGETVRLEGRGHHGPRGGPAGDLLIRCEVQRHPDFDRRGPHLRCTVPITIPEAVLGAKIDVPTLGDDETATLRLPPCTQNGRTFRLRDRGLELPDGRRGDLLVTVVLTVPDLVDEDSKELMREFAARNRHDPRSPRTQARAGT